MSNPRFKSENYSNLGGMNTKASAYLTDATEFLAIYNMDFSVPGSLTKRPGSTQYLGQTFASKITGLFEFEKLDGSSYLMVGATGGLWYGATTGQLSGLSLNSYSASYVVSFNIGAQFFTLTITSIPFGLGQTTPINFLYNAGPTGYLPFNGIEYSPTLTQYVQSARDYDNNGFGIRTGASIDYINPVKHGASFRYDFLAFQNVGYFADGRKILKFDGSTFYRFQLPQPRAPIAFPRFVGYSSMPTNLPIGATWFTPGVYYIYGQYVNNAGYAGPVGFLGEIDMAVGITQFRSDFGTFPQIVLDVFVPSEFGISAINIFIGTGQTSPIYGGSSYGVYKQSTESTYTVNSGQLAPIVLSYLNQDLSQPMPGPDQWLFGVTTGIFPSLTPSSVTMSIINHEQGSWPLFIELHANRMFFAGQNDGQSTVWFSDLAMAEKVDVTSSIEVRTNDGDKITGLKAYQNSLMIFKNRSFHQLSGDSPENFNLREMSTNYGCVNNFASATWQQRLWFLDRKGIVEFNGASFDIVSNKIESVFASMNLTAASTEAFMLHVKSRNEVWCAIPINGSTTNNCMVVYDYLANAWAVWNGFSPSYMAIIKQSLDREAAFFGDNSGRINYFATGVYSDNGTGISCSIKSRYEHPQGNSTEKQFRRVFINADSLTGASTIGLTLNLYKNYSASLVQSFGVTQGAFQTYTNFGISSKSLSVEVGHFSATDGIRLHGYTLEYRYQRSV